MPGVQDAMVALFLCTEFWISACAGMTVPDTFHEVFQYRTGTCGRRAWLLPQKDRAPQPPDRYDRGREFVLAAIRSPLSRVQMQTRRLMGYNAGTEG